MKRKQERNEEMERLVKAGLTYREVAEMFGVSTSRVGFIMARRGVRPGHRLLGCHEELDKELFAASYTHPDHPRLTFTVNLEYHSVPRRAWRVLREKVVQFLATTG